MNRRLGARSAALVACLVLAPVVAWQTAAAATLQVSAGPIQTWVVTDGMPQPPTPPVDLSVCGDVADYVGIFYGTAAADEKTAGNGRWVLVGMGGDDILRGGNHDDCLIGGEGDDRLYGENGRDILVGGEGADLLDGGTGKDQLDAGGDPGDECVSTGAPDEELVGCDGGDAEDGAGANQN